MQGIKEDSQMGESVPFLKKEVLLWALFPI
jgi:hypothetical protein